MHYLLCIIIYVLFIMYYLLCIIYYVLLFMYYLLCIIIYVLFIMYCVFYHLLLLPILHWSQEWSARFVYFYAWLYFPWCLFQFHPVFSFSVSNDDSARRSIALCWGTREFFMNEICLNYAFIISVTQNIEYRAAMVGELQSGHGGRVTEQPCTIAIFRVMNVPGRLERWAQKLAITVINSERFAVLTELFDTGLRIVTCDASRKTHIVIPMSMERWRLAKQHSVSVHMPCMGDWTWL